MTSKGITRPRLRIARPRYKPGFSRQVSFAQLFMKKISKQDSPFLFESMAVYPQHTRFGFKVVYIGFAIMNNEGISFLDAK